MGQTESTPRPRDRVGDVSNLRAGKAFRRADDKLFNKMLDKRIERIMSRNATAKSDATVEQDGVSTEMPPARTGATTFHALPLEIRREIMSYLAQERRKEPLYPDQTCTASEPMGSSGLVKQTPNPPRHALQAAHSAIFVETDQYIWGWDSLSRTNRQLRQDMKNVIEIYGDRDVLRLDVMYVDGGGIWPTWLSPSLGQKHFREVHVNFRIFYPNSGTVCDVCYVKADAEGTTRTQDVIPAFYPLLLSFLVHGYNFQPLGGIGEQESRKEIRTTHTIKRLVFNLSKTISLAKWDCVETFDPMLESFLGDITTQNPLHWPPELEFSYHLLWYHCPAELLAMYMESYLLRVIALPFESNSHVKTLYEGVGTIGFDVNKEDIYTINVSEHLCRMPSSREELSVLADRTPAPATLFQPLPTFGPRRPAGGFLVYLARARIGRMPPRVEPFYLRTMGGIYCSSIDEWRLRVNEERKGLGMDDMNDYVDEPAA